MKPLLMDSSMFSSKLGCCVITLGELSAKGKVGADGHIEAVWLTFLYLHADSLSTLDPPCQAGKSN